METLLWWYPNLNAKMKYCLTKLDSFGVSRDLISAMLLKKFLMKFDWKNNIPEYYEQDSSIGMFWFFSDHKFMSKVTMAEMW